MLNKSNNSAAENANMVSNISANYDNGLAFFQSFAVKSPQFIAALLIFCADKCACIWFHKC